MYKSFLIKTSQSKHRETQLFSYLQGGNKFRRIQGCCFIQSDRCCGFLNDALSLLPDTSPVCCSSKLPWEGPLLCPRLSAICCILGTSTEVSHDRDCRSPGRSSSLSWEGSVVRSLQGKGEGRDCLVDGWLLVGWRGCTRF